VAAGSLRRKFWSVNERKQKKEEKTDKRTKASSKADATDKAVASAA
jgi:hypothetical protein